MSKKVLTNIWLIHSGCTNHMTHDKILFKEFPIEIYKVGQEMVTRFMLKKKKMSSLKQVQVIRQFHILFIYQILIKTC